MSYLCSFCLNEVSEVVGDFCPTCKTTKCSNCGTYLKNIHYCHGCTEVIPSIINPCVKTADPSIIDVETNWRSMSLGPEVADWFDAHIFDDKINILRHNDGYRCFVRTLTEEEITNFMKAIKE